MLKSLHFFALLLLSCMGTAYAQNDALYKSYPKAQVTRERFLHLEETAQSSAKKFMIDYNALAFTSQEQAKRFFDSFDDANCSFELVPQFNWAILTINPSDPEKTTWDTKRWNDYFKAVLQKQREDEGYFIDKVK